jgi:lipopolysaccharide export system permease protein
MKMHIVKRLDLFLLQTFLPLFVMTFGICLFIFLMQFLWKYVDDMVGKGIDMSILAQLFFYTAMTLVPKALPLAILFAALMTFGSLGEHFELLAMKATGISLMRIMRPLTVFLIFTAVAAFFFQNNVIPASNLKMYTILYSVKQKSPELEIPESIFYTQVRGRNIYVKKKDKERKLLLDVMIYDYSAGFNQTRVIRADSGKMNTSVDKKYLVLTLYSGESFENLQGSKNRARDAKDPVPYRRATFDTMEMLIEFEGNFNMRDESLFQDRYVSKNIASLQHSIDSMTVRLDSLKTAESQTLFTQSYKRTLARVSSPAPWADSASIATINFDSLFRSQQPAEKAALLGYAKRNIENLQMNFLSKGEIRKAEDKELRLHHTEMHSKYTLSFACLVFFFIGAPLGAIIRKGGLGAPAVISVLLFVVYYIIDNIGYKMARDAVWEPYQGMWLSSAVLLPLGIFLTYKAVNDSVILDAETYIEPLKRLIGKREMRKVEKKEIIIDLPDYKALSNRLCDLKSSSEDYLLHNLRGLSYIDFWKSGGVDPAAMKISQSLESAVEVLKNSDNNLVLNKTMDFPVIKNYQLITLPNGSFLGMMLAIVFPIGGILYLIAAYRRKLLRQDLKTVAKVSEEIKEMIK